MVVRFRSKVSSLGFGICLPKISGSLPVWVFSLPNLSISLPGPFLFAYFENMILIKNFGNAIWRLKRFGSFAKRNNHSVPV